MRTRFSILVGRSRVRDISQGAGLTWSSLFTGAVFLVVFSLVLGGLALAITSSEEAQLVPSGGSGPSEWGTAVAVSGDTAVVGSACCGGTDLHGLVEVFVRNGSAWSWQAGLSAGDTPPSTQDLFGSSVAIEGDVAIVGASWANAAYVFRRTGVTWVEEDKLTPSHLAAGFGATVAISGDTAVVGAPGDIATWGAYVFVRDASGWTEQAFFAPIVSPFGWSVAVDGDTIVIGASNSAFVYTRSGTTWSPPVTLSESHEYFGWSVAVDGKRIVVGAPAFMDGTGAAFVFSQSGDSWVRTAMLTPSDSANGDKFGLSLALGEHKLVVGASRAYSSGSGSVYVFLPDGPNWTEEAKLVGSSTQDDEFGHAVGVDGDTVVVGAPGDENGVVGVWGAAYVFALVNDAPLATGFITSLAEDTAVGTTVGTVTASDAEGDSLSFAITAGNGVGLFTIGSATGTITTAAGLDYESTTQHVLTVTVSDGTNDVDVSVMVNVADVGGPLDVVVDPSVDSFDDDDASVFETDIEWLAAAGITRGCNPPANTSFCADDSVTRGQMAAFLHRALDGIVEPVSDPIDFTDDDGSAFEGDIAWLSATGITRGCGETEFCPDEVVTRGQMAAFLVRALGYTDSGGGDLFVDDDDSIFEADIDKLASAGVTRGCNPPENDRFCPGGRVKRGQMAAFLHRALG